MDRIDSRQELLLLLLGESLFGRKAAIPPEPDWEAVLTEAKAQAVLPLAWEAARAYCSGPAAEREESLVDSLVAKNMLLDFDHVRLHGWMSAAGIPYVVMKGSASAAYYPQPMLRMMGDVDFLVSREDAQRAGRELIKQGFRESGGESNPNHRCYLCQDDTLYRREWELHWQPNGIPGGAAGETIRALLADSVETARLRETDNGCYAVPDDFHHGLMLLIHTAMHLMHSGVGLRHLCDWAVFASSFSRERFRCLFEEKLRSAGLWDFACALTAVSVRYLGCPDPGWTGECPEELTEELICDIFSGGNFGSKDRERLNEAKLLVDRDRGMPRQGAALRNLFSAMNLKARRVLPAAQKAPILLPLGWTIAAGRHLLRILRGKRPSVHLVRTVQGASRRAALYEQLHLFADAEE